MDALFLIPPNRAVATVGPKSRSMPLLLPSPKEGKITEKQEHAVSVMRLRALIWQQQ